MRSEVIGEELGSRTFGRKVEGMIRCFRFLLFLDLIFLSKFRLRSFGWNSSIAFDLKHIVAKSE